MLYPCRHWPHLFPSIQKLPVARRSVRNTWQTLGLFSTFFSVIGQQVDLCLLFGLLRSSSISSSALGFLIHLLSLPCTAEAFPMAQAPLLWRKKTWYPFSTIRSSESKSSSEDKTKNLPPQCTNTFSRWTCKACCITGTPLSKSPGKREERWGISSTTWQRKFALSCTSSVSASWLG